MLDLYRFALRPLLFSGLKTDPEWAHQRALNLLNFFDSRSDSPLGPKLRTAMEKSFCLRDSRLEQTLWGLKFPNPLGLAAGFDKDGMAANIWPSFGFGFAELGTVTLHPQLGNPQPRLFRLLQDDAILNRMGFNNLGAAALASKLEAITKKEQLSPATNSPRTLGVNLGKSKVTLLEDAAGDYLASFRLLKDWGDYFVVNVSSPNTPGLRSLQNASNLTTILESLQEENQAIKPILIKIAPDLEWEAIASILDLAKKYQLAGIIATNTTIDREKLTTKTIDATGKPVTEEAGGISGAPLRGRSTEVIRFIWQETRGQLPIIGVGGIFTAEDAWEKITAGASLIQVYTGLVYEGPWMMKRILKGLLQKLGDRGLNSISEAVGLAQR
ncbi:MAG: quinone-dependent dihydroorotate dehydrogenase [Cyanobacteriota bacterium]|nr:quinone-dependent dihydroorotate dehydrogenase [Cyanobacteriota bacterium]